LVENGFGQVAFEGHTLNESGPIPHKQEDQLAFIGAVVNPALDCDILACVFINFFYTDNGGHDFSFYFAIIAQARVTC
jgi:hypothetical protein